jgi:hypothetical protein
MEKKKQLIIVPPMSAALQKLHEVLDGISVDENIEISMIDDLKELGQVLASTGQCLILCSNPKKCATFLQENRFVISRFHSKTMLFTPKEIPAKTLVKFTKVGLTESILENSAPKTLLYKIKLQLRSIKSTSSTDESDKDVVKTLHDISGEEKSSHDEGKVREKVSLEQESEVETEQKKKFDASEENVIDYGGSLKGKVKPQEDSIETHWKSKRKTNETILDLGGDETSKLEEEHEAIDLYYRGNSKKESVVFEEAEDYRKLKRLEKEVAEEAERKRSAYRDEVTEELMRQKKMGEENIYETDGSLELKQRLDAAIAFDESEESDSPNEMEYDPEEYEKQSKKETSLELEAEDNKSRPREFEDLGGHYKGKVTNIDLDLESEQEKEEKEYDNTETEERKKEQTELDLIAAKKRRSDQSEEELNPNNTHESEVDKIVDEMMNGKNSTDHIETLMGNGSKSYVNKKDISDEDSDLTNSEKDEYETDDSDEDRNNTKLDLSPADKKEKEKKAVYEEGGDFEFKKQAETNLDLEVEKNKEEALNDYDNAEDEDGRKKDKKLVDTELELDPNEEEGNQLEQRDISFKKLSNTTLDIEKAKADKNSNQVDKIDTYYRSNDSKTNDQDWDLKHDKKSTVLSILKTSKADINIGSNKNSKNNGEITIDYRKLKEEFDQMSRGESTSDSGAFTTRGPDNGMDPEDEGSSKVIEPNSRGLDFSVALLNVIYQKNVKPKQIFAMIAEDILKKYNGVAVFWDYKPSDKKHNEVYNSYLELALPQITDERKEWWLDYKKDTDLFSHFQTRSMTTWRCPQIMDKNSPWEDVELPTWAKNELGDKYVELAFPYFDGVDRMGLALIHFHQGIRPEDEHAILTTLEMARHLLLETIQRYQVKDLKKEQQSEDQAPEAETSNKVLSFFGGLFGKKKAG